MKNVPCALAALVALAIVSSAQAAEKAPVNLKINPLITGLDNPCGVAIQPSTGDLFVSDSAALRVVRLNPKKGQKASEVITGFSADIYGKGPMYQIGPLGLAFVDEDRLMVGGGGHKDGEELLYIFDLPPAGKKTTADQAKYKLGPISPGEESKTGEGNFYDIALADKAAYITSNGDDTKGWILRVDLSGAEPGKLEPYIPTKELLEVDAPVGITLDPRGNLLVGQAGEVNIPNDSLLTSYDTSGKLLWKAETELHDIVDVAYSPSGKLYCVDFAWVDPSEGGLFRLDVTPSGAGVQVKSTKICSLDRPTAMVFDDQGALYVTVFGTAEDGSKKKPGQLLKITGL